MMRWIATSLLVLCLLTLMLPTRATDLQRKNSLLTRMFGFQYPLDSDSNYKVGWITYFDPFEIERDFQAIRSNFSQVNLLRIPIGWEDMDNTILLTQMETVIELGKEYGFKFLFVLMDRISGWGETPTPRNLLSSEYADHEQRIKLVVYHFRNENQIYAWALSNELNVFQQVVYEWYEHFIPFLKNIDFDTPLCTSFYPLGPNATTISRAASLVDLGLDFLEFHYYPNSTAQIEEEIDQLCAYVSKPIFLSEFSVSGGINATFNGHTSEENIAILNATVQTFQKRPNVIGLSYYRWSNDYDNFTIWDFTAQAPKPEATALAISESFLSAYPYSYLESSETNSTEIYEIFDSSFMQTIAWPNTEGWTGWSNHTSVSLRSISSPDTQIKAMVKREVTNYDWEKDLLDWVDRPDMHGHRSISTTNKYNMNKSLCMWADGAEEFQEQHTAISVEPLHAYLVEIHVNVTAQAGDGSAFVQLAFLDAGGSWLQWNQSEYIHFITGDYTTIHAAGIAPPGAVSVKINCRVSGFGGSITAYFDFLTLYEVDPVTYDGRSFMMAFGECSEPSWNAAQVSQNFTFPNPSEDTKKLWVFSASIATVFSSEYDTDWKGAFIEIAFTTSNSSEWITWYIGEYLSGNNGWTDLKVVGFPPSNAMGLQMIVKVVNCHYGVLFIDNASLSSQAAVIPEEWIMPVMTQESQTYMAYLTVLTVNNTHYNCTFVSPDSWTIVASNTTWFKGNTFGSLTNGTSEMIQLTFEAGAINHWMLIGLVLGIVGFCLVIVGLLVLLRTLKQKKAERLVLSLICLIAGISLILVWVLNL